MAKTKILPQKIAKTKILPQKIAKTKILSTENCQKTKFFPQKIVQRHYFLSYFNKELFLVLF